MPYQEQTGFQSWGSDGSDMAAFLKFRGQGWEELYVEAHYHWAVLNIPKKQIYIYTEGDTSLRTYDTLRELRIAGQEHADYMRNQGFDASVYGEWPYVSARIDAAAVEEASRNVGARPPPPTPPPATGQRPPVAQYSASEVQFRTPIKSVGAFVKALAGLGIDVGTDGYYADPNNYVTVIVRGTALHRAFDLAKKFNASEEGGALKETPPQSGAQWHIFHESVMLQGPFETEEKALDWLTSYLHEKLGRIPSGQDYDTYGINWKV